ncbi:MAG: GAF domain-containing protein [Desulfobulbaceae bacterium]|nr:GAF domain-containing protein [Desulfobulbaceae bacterium]
MRKSFIITAVLIAAALGTLLVLAFNQFQLYGRHETIISQTEKILFQYSNIREQIVEDIVEGRAGELSRVSPAVEELHNNLIAILDNKLIPAEYKFSFLQQIDLPGLILLLRKTTAEQDNTILLRRINEESRVIGERFMLFERLVLGHAKQKLVDFQAMVIGILALVVFLVTVLLVVTYRFLIAPVIDLSIQAENLIAGRQESIDRPNGWEEVAGLAQRLNLLADDLNKCRKLTDRYDRLGDCIHSVVQKALAAPDRQVLYQVVCRQLLTNSDYVLAWIGIEDREDREIMPLVVDGSATMSCEECQECFSAILAAQEEQEPAYRALEGGEPVLMRDVLAKAPKGPFKNTPLATGRVDSISLPLDFDGRKYGVLTVYAMNPDGALDVEAELLAEMAVLVAGKIRSLDFQAEADRFRLEKNVIGEYTEVLSFTIDRETNVLAADTYLADSAYQETLARWIGSSVMDAVLPENDSERIVFKNSIREGSHYDFTTKLAGFDEQFSARLEPINEFPAEQELLLLILVAPPKNLLLQPENFRIAYSAAIGQFAGSIAHEITDMSNGIINYAQMMSDEFSDDEPDRKRSLGRIIEGGEKVAAIVEPLLIDQEDLEFTRNMENIQQIFQDVLRLVDPQFKRDCVTVNLSIQPTSLTFKKQHVQLILFDLLKRLSEILNRIYPQKNAEKVLDISVSPYSEDGKKTLLVHFRFPADSDGSMEQMFQQRTFAGMWLSRELARALGGEVTVAATESGRGQVDLLLPV